MNIWLDGVDLNLIKKGKELGVLHGITTNPSIIAESNQPLEKILSAVLKSFYGLVTVQVLAEQVGEIVEQAETLRDHSERVIVKIPVTGEGLKAMHALSHLQLPIMATSIVTPFQALLACHAGANYLAPYFSHILETKASPDQALETMLHFIELYEFDTKLIVASLRSLDQVMTCLEIGVHGITLKPPLFEELIQDHPVTLQSIEKFKTAAKKGATSKLIPL